jgi:CBS domain-containing protein
MPKQENSTYDNPFISIEFPSLIEDFMPTVKEIMTKDVTTIDTDKTVFEAAQLMSTEGLGCLIVMNKDFPVGIITERDIVRRIVAKRSSTDVKVEEIMSKTLITIEPDVSLKDAARVMSTNGIRRLPVLKNNKLVGIVVASDFVRNVGKKTTSEEILDALGRYPTGSPV